MFNDNILFFIHCMILLLQTFSTEDLQIEVNKLLSKISSVFYVDSSCFHFVMFSWLYSTSRKHESDFTLHDILAENRESSSACNQVYVSVQPCESSCVSASNMCCINNDLVVIFCRCSLSPLFLRVIKMIIS